MEVNEKVIRDVLVGDVYLCGGQSNQETPIERLVEKFPEIPVSNNHMIRHYKVPSQDVTDGVREEIAGDAVWHSATASEVMNWTSLAYFSPRKCGTATMCPWACWWQARRYGYRVVDQSGASERFSASLGGRGGCAQSEGIPSG